MTPRPTIARRTLSRGGPCESFRAAEGPRVPNYCDPSSRSIRSQHPPPPQAQGLLRIQRVRLAVMQRRMLREALRTALTASPSLCRPFAQAATTSHCSASDSTLGELCPSGYPSHAIGTHRRIPPCARGRGGVGERERGGERGEERGREKATTAECTQYDRLVVGLLGHLENGADFEPGHTAQRSQVHEHWRGETSTADRVHFSPLPSLLHPPPLPCPSLTVVTPPLPTSIPLLNVRAFFETRPLRVVAELAVAVARRMADGRCRDDAHNTGVLQEGVPWCAKRCRRESEEGQPWCVCRKRKEVAWLFQPY